MVDLPFLPLRFTSLPVSRLAPRPVKLKYVDPMQYRTNAAVRPRWMLGRWWRYRSKTALDLVRNACRWDGDKTVGGLNGLVVIARMRCRPYASEDGSKASLH